MSDMTVDKAREIVERSPIVTGANYQQAKEHKAIADSMGLGIDHLRSFAKGFIKAHASRDPEVESHLKNLKDASLQADKYEATIKRQREEVEKLKAEIKLANANFEVMKGLYDEEREASRKLEMYVSHLSRCEWSNGLDGTQPNDNCSCGLKALMESHIYATPGHSPLKKTGCEWRDDLEAEREATRKLVKAAKLVLESHRRTCPGESCGTMGIDLLDMELKSYNDATPQATGPWPLQGGHSPEGKGDLK